MTYYLFCENQNTVNVASVYDDEVVSVDMKYKVYHLLDGHTEAHLACHILNSFDFRSSEKSLYAFGELVIDKIKLYEAERDYDDDDSIVAFIELLHHQDYLDGVKFPMNYQDPMPLRKIIIKSFKLGIIREKTIMKYLWKPSSDATYTYSLSVADIESC